MPKNPFDDDIDMFSDFGDGDDENDFGFGGVNNFSNSMQGQNSGMNRQPLNNKAFNNNFGFAENSFDEDEDDSDDFETDNSFDDAPIQSSKSSSNIAERMEEAKAKDFKKTAIMLIVVGIVVLLFAVVGIRVVNSAKNSSNTSVSQISSLEKNNKSENSVSSQKVENNISNNSVSLSSSWQEVNLSGVDLGETWIESDFTITDLKHYAMVSNSLNDKQVKSIAKGNISGLVGTYEMEIPTYMALKLSVGTSFKIKYQLKEQNGYKLIGDIQY